MINQINNETGIVASTISGVWKFDDVYKLTQIVETTPMYGLVVRRKKKDDVVVIDNNLIVLEPFKRIDLI